MRAPPFTPPLLVFASLFVPLSAQAAAATTVDLDLGGGVSLRVVRLPGGPLVQGSPATEVDHKDDEKQRTITLSAFFLGRTPVTVGQWKRFVSGTGFRSEAEKGTSGGFGWDGKALVQKGEYTWKNPGFAQTDDHPVTIVTYDDALAFTRWASGVTGKNVTLPTEAQWEYGYRAGSTGAYYTGGAADALSIGWFKENAGNGTRPVGQKKPNAWGLVDMGGNVWQWCLDWYAPYPETAATDPMQEVPDASEKSRRVLRGGSWLKEARNGRAAARFRSTPGSRNADYGFRVAVVDTPPQMAAPGPFGTTTGLLPRPNPTRPAESIPTDPETNDGMSPLAIAAIVLAPILFIGTVIGTLFRSKGGKQSGLSSGGVSIRPGKDGFWIDAGPKQIGARITVHYRAMGAERVTHATVERADDGQFVYTGYEPDGLRLVEVVPAAPAYRTADAAPKASSWGSSSPSRGSSSYGSSSSSYDSSSSSYDSSSSSGSSFQGYPPAY